MYNKRNTMDDTENRLKVNSIRQKGNLSLLKTGRASLTFVKMREALPMRQQFPFHGPHSVSERKLLCFQPQGTH